MIMRTAFIRSLAILFLMTLAAGSSLYGANGLSFDESRIEVTVAPEAKTVTVPYFFTNNTDRTITIKRKTSNTHAKALREYYDDMVAHFAPGVQVPRKCQATLRRIRPAAQDSDFIGRLPDRIVAPLTTLWMDPGRKWGGRSPAS